MFLLIALLIAVIYYRFWNVSCLNDKPKPVLKDLKIIGIVLPRSATSSLTKALQMLGYNTHHFPLRFFEKEHLYRQQKDALIDWVTLGFRPVQLQNMFPNALFIYTYRDFDSWQKSMIYLRKLLHLYPPILRKFDEVFGPQNNWHQFKQDYEAEIKQMTTKNILFLDFVENPCWQPICEKLNLPIPQTSFPHKKEQLQQVIIEKTKNPNKKTPANFDFLFFKN